MALSPNTNKFLKAQLEPLKRLISRDSAQKRHIKIYRHELLWKVVLRESAAGDCFRETIEYL